MMDKRLTRALTAVGTAGVMALGLGATAASAAAAPARGLHDDIYTTTQAGYRIGTGTGWRFRWIASKVRVFSCADAAATHGWKHNEVMLGATNRKHQAEVWVECGDVTTGKAPVRYRYLRNGNVKESGTLPIHPVAGEWVQLNIYYDQKAGEVEFGAKVRRGSVTKTLRIGKKIDFLGAEVASVFGKTEMPASPTRTARFTDSAATSYNVTRGTLLGPWPTSRLVVTKGGTSTGEVIARPTKLRDDGRTFAVRQIR